MATNAPPDCGRRLIPQILDRLAATDPDRIIYSVAQFSGTAHGFRRISARTFAKAVDKTAWWLHHQVGKPTTVRTVGYIGPHDIRHIILTYACVKAGYSALYLSPKNSVEGATAVLGAAECDIWVKPCEQPRLPLVEELLQRRSMKLLELPETKELLDAELSDPFLYNKSFDEAIQDPFCLLHTSGTTGLPKPIVWSNGLIGTMDAVQLLPPTEGDGGLAPWTSLWKEGDTIYSAFPMSHGAGIIMDILLPSLLGLHCVLGPAGVLPNMDLVQTLADHANIDIWSMVPSLVDELGETPDILAKFKPSKFICASGGPVSPRSAGKVNEVVRVLNLTGTTEGLFIGNLVVEREDWFWFAFHPYSGFEFKEVQPDVYEHWVHRNEHWLLFQGIFHTFPTQQSYNFKDLYIKHPTKPNLWAFKGRNDDIIVLSNSYKIAPLETESLIATHPAVEGCLMIGTGKPQAGLLIELKDPSSRDNELFDSIWSTVEKANSLSLHKNQLHRDYVTFAEPGKPFIRTDKGTVKRRATLELYADYIERFYVSRDEDSVDAVTVDTSSPEAIMDSLRQIFGDLVPAIRETSPDTDIFSLGLDSLLVFRAVKAIRAATGLKELAPRHLYASPTLDKFSVALARLSADSKKVKGATSGHPIDDNVTRMKMMIEKHKVRQSFKLNPFDYVNGIHYMALNFFFSLRKDVSFKQAYAGLQRGLRRTLELVPALDGKLIRCSPDEMDYAKGDLRVSVPLIPLSTASDKGHTDTSSGPRQLSYKDLSQVLPPYEKLRENEFPTSVVRDELLSWVDPFKQLPADIMIAQANFVEGGCILTVELHHSCFDGYGFITAMRVWGENCRFTQGDESAVCEWLDPECFNHSLPEILYEQEGYAKPAHEVDPGVWGFLPYLRPETPPGEQIDNPFETVKPLKNGANGTHEFRVSSENHVNGTIDAKEPSKNHVNGASKNVQFDEAPVNGTQDIQTSSNGSMQTNELSENHVKGTSQTEQSIETSMNGVEKPLEGKKIALPPAPELPHNFQWPPPPIKDPLRTTMFRITAPRLRALQEVVLADPCMNGAVASMSDIVQAFFWRSTMKVRHRIATERRGETIAPDAKSVLEISIDGRPYFSPLLPPTYMGSMLIFNRPTMSVEKLCSSDTRIGQVAYAMREAAARITPSLLHDSLTLLRSLPDYTRFTLAGMGVDEGFRALLTNLMLFQTDGIDFGREFFANGGEPHLLRPLVGRGNKGFRFLVIHPIRKDGGLELGFGTNREELKMLMEDEEFTRYAKLVDVC